MRAVVAVILVSLAVLFLLTSLALAASRRLRHPLWVVGALTVLLALGVVLLAG
jgi:hypothetical protein